MALVVASPAAADPEVKLLLQRDDQGGTMLVPDRPLPASRAFTVHYALPPDVTRGSGYLEVWPKLEDTCEATRPDIRQSHSIALALSMVDGKATLAGYVPPLQVDLEYCLKLHTFLGLGAAQLSAIATLAADAMRGTLLGSPTACADASHELFESSLKGALIRLGISASNLPLAAAAARAELFAKTGDVCSRLGEVDRLSLQKKQLVDVALAKTKAETAIDTFDEKLAPLPAPLTVVNGVPALVDAGKKPKPPSELELWDGETVVPAASVLKAVKPRTPAVTDVAIAALKLGPRSPANLKLLELFERARDRRLEFEALEKAVAAGETSVAKVKDELTKTLVAAFSAPGVASTLRNPERPMFAEPTTAGSGETPNKLNYASVDVGLLAAPTGFAVWFLPYVGLNVYAVAVDRTIGLNRLSGSMLRRVLQVLSVTLGATLAAPGGPGVVVQAPFLSTYPLVGLGARVANFVRVTGGALFYVLGDADGLSAKKTLHASFFFGASLDLDLVELLTRAAGG
ncbi:MAG: hypothetical protein JNK82_13085 [Myxococcaceae bacterium]|nr:hypothetical protein [Myxococcaceae bacterium]